MNCPICDKEMPERAPFAEYFQISDCTSCYGIRAHWKDNINISVRRQGCKLDNRPIIMSYVFTPIADMPANIARLCFAIDFEDIIVNNLDEEPGLCSEPCDNPKDALSPEWWQRIINEKAFL